MNQPLDTYFGPQSECIRIDFETSPGWGGSYVDIEVEADPNTYIRVTWGDAPAKICQHYTQSLQLTHSSRATTKVEVFASPCVWSSRKGRTSSA